jgi:hypothetical protein
MKKNVRSSEIGAMFSLFWIILSLSTYKLMWTGIRDKETWIQISFAVIYVLAIWTSIKEIKKAFFKKTSN